MRNFGKISVLLAACLLLLQANPIAQPEVDANMNIKQGVYYANLGDEITAGNYFAEAKEIAVENNLYRPLLEVAKGYAGMEYDAGESWRCFELATDIAYNLAERDYRSFAIIALQQCLDFYENNLTSGVLDANNQKQLTLIAEHTHANINQLENYEKTSGVEMGIDAFASYNHTSVGMRTRGFGDSEDAGVWVPFNFSFRPCGSNYSARIVLDVRPMNVDLKTQEFRVIGKSGTVYIYHPVVMGKKWKGETKRMIIEVDLTTHPNYDDVLGALNTGFVEASFGDETAVFGAKLVMHCILQ